MSETKEWSPGGESKETTGQQSMLVWYWIVLAFLFPLVGLIAGIWGVHKEEKKDGGTLVAMSIGFWFFWFLWAIT